MLISFLLQLEFGLFKIKSLPSLLCFSVQTSLVFALSDQPGFLAGLCAAFFLANRLACQCSVTFLLYNLKVQKSLGRLRLIRDPLPATACSRHLKGKHFSKWRVSLKMKIQNYLRKMEELWQESAWKLRYPEATKHECALFSLQWIICVTQPPCYDSSMTWQINDAELLYSCIM